VVFFLDGEGGCIWDFLVSLECDSDRVSGGRVGWGTLQSHLQLHHHRFVLQCLVRSLWKMMSLFSI